MIQQNLAKGMLLERTANHIHVQFDTPHRVISSAVLNGGFVKARHILNLNVRDQIKMILPAPDFSR